MSEEQPKSSINIEELFENMKKFGVTEFEMGSLKIKMQQEPRHAVQYQQPDYTRGFDK